MSGQGRALTGDPELLLGHAGHDACRQVIEADEIDSINILQAALKVRHAGRRGTLQACAGLRRLCGQEASLVAALWW